MPDLTAEQLWAVVEPVWKKHPGTRPEELRYAARPIVMELDHSATYTPAGWYLEGRLVVFAEDAALLCEAQMTRWLAGRHWLSLGEPGPPFFAHVTRKAWALEYYGDDSRDYTGRYEADTIVEALAAACLAVPKDTDADPG